MSIVDEMTKDAIGDYVVFEEGDEKILKIVAEPTSGDSNFKNPDKTPKKEWRFECMEDDDPAIKKWTISSKPVIGIIAKIMTDAGLEEFSGLSFRVSASGSGRDRRYFIKLVGGDDQTTL